MQMSRRSFLKFLCAVPAVVVAAKIEQIAPSILELAANPDTSGYVASEAGYGNYYFQFAEGLILRTSDISVREPEAMYLADVASCPLGAGHLKLPSREPTIVSLTITGSVQELSTVLHSLEDRQYRGGVTPSAQTVKVFYEDFDRVSPPEQLAEMYHTYLQEISPFNLDGIHSSATVALAVGGVKVFQGVS
jgi:hypothetical protein